MFLWILIIAVALLILSTAYMSIYSIFKESSERKHHAKKKEAEKAKKKSKKKAPSREDKEIIDIKKSEVKVRKPKVTQPRRWKIILEDMSSGDINDFIFVQSVGIGRTTQDVAFEKFLSIPEDKRISKVHCSITMIDDGLYIKDEGSRNHTYLNGKKVQKPVLLQKEDVISIGETDLEVVKIFRESER